MRLNQNTFFNLIESFDSGKMPTMKVLGIIALVGLLSVVLAVSIRTRRKK